MGFLDTIAPFSGQAPVQIYGTKADSSTSIGVRLGTQNNRTIPGAKPLVVVNNNAEIASVEYDGHGYFIGLTSQGMIDSTSGGYTFPDATIQDTAAGAITCGVGSAVTTIAETSTCTSNIDSATSLLADPGGCGSPNTFATEIDQFGNLTCSAWTHLFWGSQHTDVYTGDAVAHGALAYYSEVCPDGCPEGEQKWRLLYRAASDDAVLMSGGAASAPHYETVPDSDGTTQKLQYDQSTNTWSAGTDLNTNYTIQAAALNAATTTDAQTIYFGCSLAAPTTSADIQPCIVSHAGTIKSAYVYAHAGTAGSNTSWSCNVVVTGVSTTLIQALSSSSTERMWSNTGLSISVSARDHVEIQCVNPTWPTNPANVLFSAVLYIE